VPAPNIRSEFRYRRFNTDALGPLRDLPDPPLEAVQGFGSNRVARLGTPPGFGDTLLIMHANAAQDRAASLVLAGLVDMYISYCYSVYTRQGMKQWRMS